MREMRNGGVEWIGKIPKDWNIEPLKSKFAFGKGLPISKANLTDCGYPVLSYGQIHSKKNNPVHILPELIRYVGNEFSDYKQSWANEGDILFADTSEDVSGIGNHSYVDLQDGIYAGYHTILARKLTTIDSRYFSFQFQTDAWRYQLRQYATGIKVFSITKRMLSNANVLVPPLAIQQRIADYLDDKCSKIDTIIAKQEKIIDKLKEYRVSIITEKVTKGLCDNLKYKDSGLEWIGLIPEHWSLQKLKYLAEIMRGRFNHRPRNDPRFYDGEFPFVQTGDVARAEKYITEFSQTLNMRGRSVSKEFPTGSICMTIAANVGDVAILNFDACFPDSIVGFVPKNDISRHYLFYVLKAMKQQLVRNAIISTQLNLNIEIIKEEFIPLPTEEEQIIIAKYLDQKCESIDKQVARREQLISKLTEYKKSLIYECVTGKKEVC